MPTLSHCTVTPSAPRRTLLAGFALALAFALAGCGSELAQRQSFIAFLQTRIIDKQGLRIPRLTPDEAKSFGEYASHFSVIRTFHDDLDKSVSKPMNHLLGARMIRTLPDLMSRRKDLAAMREFTDKLGGAIDATLAKATADRAALKQPEDLKVVYDRAFAKSVTAPAQLIREVVPAISATLHSADKLAQYIDAHSGKLKVRGAMLETNDPKIRTEVNALITELSENGKGIADAQRKLQSLAM